MDDELIWYIYTEIPLQAGSNKPHFMAYPVGPSLNYPLELRSSPSHGSLTIHGRTTTRPM